MSNLKSIFQNDSCNMLDVIFDARAEILSTMISKDIDIIEKVNKKTNNEYANLKETLNKIPDEYQEEKRRIIEAFNEYTNALEYREGYFNEKYYKEGIKDGINIIIKCF